MVRRERDSLLSHLILHLFPLSLSLLFSFRLQLFCPRKATCSRAASKMDVGCLYTAHCICVNRFFFLLPSSHPKHFSLLLLLLFLAGPHIYCWYFTYLPYAAGRRDHAFFPPQRRRRFRNWRDTKKKTSFLFFPFCVFKSVAAVNAGPSFTQDGQHHLLKATLSARRELLLLLLCM